MAIPRRRLVRPSTNAAPAAQPRHPRLQVLRARLGRDRAARARWMSRLRRAFHAAEKLQAKIGRVDRQITRLGDHTS